MRRTRVAVGAVAVVTAFSTCFGTGTELCLPDGDTGVPLRCPPNTACSRDLAGPVCIRGTCGNGDLDIGERCDDGNIIDGDGCSADCQSIEICGNGIID